MTIFKSMIIAFSMYSKIPMPRIDWNKDNMKYSMCFFPIIGLVIGVLVILWALVSNILDFNSILFAAVATFIPIMVTGGVHMDGYCDTIDGLSSNQPMEKKIKILSDPNSGAFAIIKTNGYFLIYFAIFTQVDKEAIIIIAFSYIISRILSALAVIKFKSAKAGGILYGFKDNSNKKIVMTSLIIMLLIVSIVIIFINPQLAIVSILTALLVFLYYRHISYKEFGGTTGDLAGYFLQLCELSMAFSVVIAQGVMGLWY